MKLRMPESVKIGPHTYTIVRAYRNGANGYCDMDGLKLAVQPRLRKTKAQEVLLHEIVHALTHPTLCGSGKFTDEEFVTGVTPLLLQVLKENPGLLSYLIQP